MSQPADIFTEIRDIRIAGGFAELDILMDWDALHNLKGHPLVLDLLFEGQYALIAPHLTGRNVVDRGYNALHVGNLPDIG